MADNVIVRVPEQQFIRGEDGYSPEVTIENIDHGHSVNITDREHPEGQTFNVMDGDSAYEQAVAGGYTGTEAQFNEELSSFKELSDETKDAAPFYAEYGVTTKAEIETAINGKRQIYVHSALGMDYAPLVGTFIYLPMFGNVPQTGYRFAAIEGTTQYIYDLRDEWSTSENDLTAPAQRAEAAAAQALTRMNSADASAQAAAGSAGNASTAATTATTKAGEASDSATAADGSAKDSEAYAIGKRGGTDVGSTDPAYHNNAKYYAEQAAGSATAASGSATSAASSATAAGNAQTAAETAQAAAEDAQEAAEAVLASIPEDYTELSGDVDNLKSAVDQKAPAIYNTASGAIASFDDGTDGMPFKALNVNFEAVQAEGTPSLEAPLPITGWTGCTVYLAGKNLMPDIKMQDSANRVVFGETNGVASGVYALFLRAGKYTLKLKRTNDIAFAIYYVRKGGTQTTIAGSSSTDTKYDVVLSKDGWYHFWAYKSGGISPDDMSDVVLALNAADYDVYEPYQGNTYSITFPGEANTVYGGTLDLVGKKLLVDTACIKSTWGAGTNETQLGNFVRRRFTFDNGKRIDGSRIAECRCNVTDRIIPDGYTGQYTHVTAIDTYPYISVILPSGTDDSTPIEFFSPITVPDNYDIINDNAIVTLHGENNIWADCGDVSADYPVDTAILVNDLIRHPPLSWGRANVLARARHFLDIEWAPVAPFPLCTGSYKYRIVPAGEKLQGLPYSSTRNVCKLIGVNISIYTFMTALANPRSVLYTRKITTGYLGASYYGQHCASFVAYANGDKGCAIDSLGMADIYSKEISKYELQPGDMLICAKDRTLDPGYLQHCLLVYDAYKDKYGRTVAVQIVEGTEPFAKYGNWGRFSSRIDGNMSKGYKCYRGNNVDATPYSKSEFVKGYPDETLPQFVYPDIMPEYGDKACVEAGTDVIINVINPKTYTQIEVYKDGTLIDTRSAISDFTMTDIAYGKYRFVLTNGSNTSESSLIAVAVSGTYDSNTGIVTFSCSNNAKPVAMQSYADEVSKPGMGGTHNLEHLFTEEEISNGQANASSIISQEYPNVQVSVLSEYGTATWSSLPLNDQWAYWEPDALQLLTNPADIKVSANSSFSMTVAANKTNVSYDWQYYYQNKWTSFQNANSATLTKTANRAWNGWKIRCIVTDADNPSNSVTSRVATLTVT